MRPLQQSTSFIFCPPIYFSPQYIMAKDESLFVSFPHLPLNWMPRQKCHRFIWAASATDEAGPNGRPKNVGALWRNNPKLVSEVNICWSGCEGATDATCWRVLTDLAACQVWFVLRFLPFSWFANQPGHVRTKVRGPTGRRSSKLNFLWSHTHFSILIVTQTGNYTNSRVLLCH